MRRIVALAALLAVAPPVAAVSIGVEACGQLGSFAYQMGLVRDMGADPKRVAIVIRELQPLPPAYERLHDRILRQVFASSASRQDIAEMVHEDCIARLGEYEDEPT